MKKTIAKVGYWSALIAFIGAVGYIAVAYFYPTFSVPILMFGLPWAITVPGSLLLLALFFRRKTYESTNEI